MHLLIDIFIIIYQNSKKSSTQKKKSGKGGHRDKKEITQKSEPNELKVIYMALIEKIYF